MYICFTSVKLTNSRNVTLNLFEHYHHNGTRSEINVRKLWLMCIFVIKTNFQSTRGKCKKMGMKDGNLAWYAAIGEENWVRDELWQANKLLSFNVNKFRLRFGFWIMWSDVFNFSKFIGTQSGDELAIAYKYIFF